MGFTLSVQLKPCLLTRVPVGCLFRLCVAQAAFSTIPYYIYQQQTPIYVPLVEVYFPAVFGIIIKNAVGTLLVTLSRLTV